MTTIINLFGGANSGKSTTAAGIYYEMKKRNMHCELVREYIKNWCYEGRTPGKWDQQYVGQKQTKYESLLYGKVDFIVTDSPFFLSDYYENLHHGTHVSKPSMLAHLENCRENGIHHVNLWLDTVPHIETRGRFQTPKEIREMPIKMKPWFEQIMAESNSNWEDVPVMGPDDRVKHILNRIISDL